MNDIALLFSSWLWSYFQVTLGQLGSFQVFTDTSYIRVDTHFRQIIEGLCPILFCCFRGKYESRGGYVKVEYQLGVNFANKGGKRVVRVGCGYDHFESSHIRVNFASVLRLVWVGSDSVP